MTMTINKMLTYPAVNLTLTDVLSKKQSLKVDTKVLMGQHFHHQFF